MSVSESQWLRSSTTHDIERYAIETSMRDLPAPRSARLVAGVLLALLPIGLVLLLLVPWQQSAVGAGRVIAYAPAERTQSVESPVTARVGE